MEENGKPHELATYGSDCIVCDLQTVEQFLDLGSTALANKFLTREGDFR